MYYTYTVKRDAAATREGKTKKEDGARARKVQVVQAKHGTSTTNNTDSTTNYTHSTLLYSIYIQLLISKSKKKIACEKTIGVKRR